MLFRINPVVVLQMSSHKLLVPCFGPYGEGERACDFTASNIAEAGSVALFLSVSDVFGTRTCPRCNSAMPVFGRCEINGFG